MTVNPEFYAGSSITAAALNSVVPSVAYVTSNQTVNSTSSVAITGLSWAVSIGTYTVKAIILATQGAATAQQAIGITGPTASLVDIAVETVDTTASSAVVAWGASELTAMGTRASLAQIGSNISATHTFFSRIEGSVTFTAAGTFSLTCSCVTLATDTWTIRAGSRAELLQS